MNKSAVKSERLLQIYAWLVSGDVLSKKEMAQKFHVTERSIQRDMESLCCFLQIKGYGRTLSTIKERTVIAWNRRPCQC